MILAIRRMETVILSLVFSACMLPGLVTVIGAMQFPDPAGVILLVLLALCFALGLAGAVVQFKDNKKRGLILAAGVVGLAGVLLMAYLSFAVSVPFVFAFIGGAGLIIVSILSKGRRL